MMAEMMAENMVENMAESDGGKLKKLKNFIKNHLFSKFTSGKSKISNQI